MCSWCHSIQILEAGKRLTLDSDPYCRALLLQEYALSLVLHLHGPQHRDQDKDGRNTTGFVAAVYLPGPHVQALSLRCHLLYRAQVFLPLVHVSRAQRRAYAGEHFSVMSLGQHTDNATQGFQNHLGLLFGATQTAFGRLQTCRRSTVRGLAATDLAGTLVAPE